MPVIMLGSVAIVKELASFVNKYIFSAEVIVAQNGFPEFLPEQGCLSEVIWIAILEDCICTCRDLSKLAGNEAGGIHTIPALENLTHGLHTLCALWFMSQSIINKMIGDLATYPLLTLASVSVAVRCASLTEVVIGISK